MSCPIVWICICSRIAFRLAVEAAMAAMPEPGKLILDVDENLYTISGCPSFLHSMRISMR